jgi:muramoyltetrapeptide carboxypeptidase
MIRPPLLAKGDAVAIVAPARKIDKESVEKATQVLESWGLQVCWAEKLFSEEHTYFSAANASRIRDFQAALDDASIKAIFCARGGYGSTSLIDHLNFSSFAKNPKWIVGFSDVTAIHLHLHTLSVESIHGTMPLLFSKPEAHTSTESLRVLLMEGPRPLHFSSTSDNKKGTATGRLLGGNLSLLVDSLGTQSEADTKGCILIVEEVDEYFYKIDRMLTQLNRAGKLSSLAALVVGHFSDIKETSLPFGETVEDIIKKHTAKYDYPVAFGLPSGHAEPNLAWIQGAGVKLNVTESSGVIVYN